HARNEALLESTIYVELFGAAGEREDECGVSALTVVQEREGDWPVQVQRSLVEDVFPGWILDGIETDYSVASVDASQGRCGCGGDVVRDSRAGGVGVDLVVHHEG